jgi:hypothetical protein
MGTGMPDALPLGPIVVNKGVSIARLHGEACFGCGAVSKTLRAAGHVKLRGSDRVWQIVTCGCRNTAAAACTPQRPTDPGDRSRRPRGMANARTREGASTSCKLQPPQPPGPR